jgi:hypothetical protein
MAQVSEVVPAYIKLRDHIDELEREHKEKLKPLKEKLEYMDTWLLGELEKRGEDSIAIRGVGTVFKKKETRCSVADWGAVFPWVQANERWDMLNHAVNKTTVTAYVDEHGEPPPGVNYTAAWTVQINRARGT